jgi:hypothetical protein
MGPSKRVKARLSASASFPPSASPRILTFGAMCRALDQGPTPEMLLAAQK